MAGVGLTADCCHNYASVATYIYTYAVVTCCEVYYNDAILTSNRGGDKSGCARTQGCVTTECV